LRNSSASWRTQTSQISDVTFHQEFLAYFFKVAFFDGMIKMAGKKFSKWSVKKENLFEERKSRDEFIFF
jgi:hypothetical protein